MGVGDSVGGSGVVGSVDGSGVVGSVDVVEGIFMQTPSLHFSSFPQSVAALWHSFWKVKFIRGSLCYVDICFCLCLNQDIFSFLGLPLDIHILLTHLYLMDGLSLVSSLRHSSLFL